MRTSLLENFSHYKNVEKKMLSPKIVWLFVAVIWLVLCNVNAVDIACHVNGNNECVFDQDVDLTGKQEVKITNSDELLEATTAIVMQSPFKTNFIPFVIFDKFPNLKSLTISGVGLKEISNDDFVNAKSLTKLNIVYNNIDTLKAQSFSPLKHLEELNLSENEFRKIENGAFEGLVELKKFDLYGNNKIPDLDVTYLPKLRSLVVAFNDYPYSPPYNTINLAKVLELSSKLTKEEVLSMYVQVREEVRN